MSVAPVYFTVPKCTCPTGLFDCVLCLREFRAVINNPMCQSTVESDHYRTDVIHSVCGTCMRTLKAAQERGVQ